jgi:TPR repeat protein
MQSCQILQKKDEESDELIQLKKKAEGNLISWYHKYNVAEYYLNETHKEADLKQGLYWLEQSSHDGYNLAGTRIGDMYLFGYKLKEQEIKTNYELALSWYEKSYKIEKNSQNTFRLSYVYENGLGTKKDLDKALEYYKELYNSIQNINSYSGNFNDENYNTKSIYNKIIYMEKTIKNQKIEKENSIILEKYNLLDSTFESPKTIELKKAALDGWFNKVKLANHYLNAFLNVDANIEKAIHWLELGANESGIPAMELGDLYLVGKRVNEDFLKADLDLAFSWYEKSYNKGKNPYISFRLAKMYENGWGTKMDLDKALHLYDEALSGMKDNSYSFIFTGKEYKIKDVKNKIAEVKKKIKKH